MIKPLLSITKRSFVLLGLIAAAQTQAQVITNNMPLYEGFNYASNNERLGVAAGFNTVNWAVSLNSSGTGSAVITNGFTNEVVYAGLPAPVGNLLCVTPVAPASGRNRGMSFPLQTLSAANPTVYYSFLLNVKANPGLLKPIFALSSSQSSLATPMTVFLTDAGKLAIGKNSSSAATVTNATALGAGTHLVVIRYKFVSGSANDELDLWIDPSSLGAPESSLPTTTNLITFSGSDATTLGSIALVHPAISPTSPGNFYIDELRIGTNWAQVTPAGCTPGTTFAVTGGGAICAGDPGVSIGLAGSDTGVDYHLRLAGNDVGSPVAGTGSAISFGLQNTAGTYTVLASNVTTLCTGNMSGSAVVTLNTSPTIVTQPSAQVVPVGGGANFSVGATGAGLTYQWKHDGTNISNGGSISGATSATLTINPVTVLDGALAANGYECAITGTCSPSTNSDRVALTVTLPNNLTWVGDGSANLWDTSTANWTGDATVFASNDNVTFTDAGSATPAVDLVGAISVNNLTVNATQNYSIGTTTSGSLATVNSLVKTNTGKLTLSTANNFTGKTAVNGGTLSIATGSNLGAAPGAFVADQLTLNGGALEVTASGSVNANRGVTLGTAGGTFSIPSGVLFTNTPVITGAGVLNKIDVGSLTLPVANTYAGGTTISNGILVILNGSSLGTGTATLAGGTLTIPGATTLANSVNVTANSTLSFANTGNSAVVLNGTGLSGTPGTTLTITPTGASTTGTRVRVNNGLTNSITFNANLNLNGTFTFATYNNVGDQTYNGVISGAGTLGRRSPLAGTAGRTILTGNNTYTGGTAIADGAIGFGIDSTGSPTVTSGPVGTGAITFENNAGTLHRLYASGGARIVGNNLTWPSGANQDLTIEGANALTLNGDMDLGAATRTLAISNTANTTFGGIISNGGLVKTGSGTLLLNGVNTFASASVVSNGVLGGTGTIAAPLTIDVAGTLAPGVSGIGTLTVNNNLTLLGATAVDINKTALTSDQVTGISTATYGGTLTINNLSGTLAPGDNFTLFSASSHSGSFASYSPATPGAGLAWSFSNGVLSVVTGVNTNSTNIVYSVSGPNEIICWPTDHIGWRLQVQTNSLNVGLGTNWVDVAVPNGYSCFTNTLNPANQAVFYRMVYP